MWQELFAFIESYIGVALDPSEALAVLEGETAIVDNFYWKTSIQSIISDLKDMLNCLEEHKQDAPDSLGNVQELKRDFAEYVINSIIDNINSAKMMVNLTITQMNGIDGLLDNIQLFCSLMDFVKENTLDEIMSQGLFEKFDEENDGDITRVLKVHKNDIMTIHDCVSSIMTEYDEV